MTSIYCAGKMGKNDWRGTRSQDGDLLFNLDAWPGGEWPVTKNHICGFDYTGPYALSCDHGCAHGPNTHGNGENCCSGRPMPRFVLAATCLAAIDRADVFFAWLSEDDLEDGHITAYGTLVEIGYAKAADKPIYIGIPAGPAVVGPLDEAWFALEVADLIIAEPTPLACLKVLADQLRPVRLDSPIEEAFWAAHVEMRTPALQGLVTQHEVATKAGKFRLDFALPEIQFGIELDGYQYHSSKEAFTKDRARQRALEAIGWRFVRFSGSEVHASPEQCVIEAASAAQSVRMGRA